MWQWWQWWLLWHYCLMCVYVAVQPHNDIFYDLFNTQHKILECAVLIHASADLFTQALPSLVSRPSLAPVFGCFCKRSKTGAGEGLGTRLGPSCTFLSRTVWEQTLFQMLELFYTTCTFVRQFSQSRSTITESVSIAVQVSILHVIISPFLKFPIPVFRMIW